MKDTSLGMRLLEQNKQKEIKLREKKNEIRNELLVEAFANVIIRCGERDTVELDESQKELIKESTEQLIRSEGGASAFLMKNVDKTYALQECVKVFDKYYNIISEAAAKSIDPDIFQIDVDLKNQFYKELDGVELEEADYIISKRIRNNTYDYIKHNIIYKDKISDIISSTTKKIEELDKKREDTEYIKTRVIKEAASLKSKIQQEILKTKNPFGKVVKCMTSDSYINNTLINRVKIDGTKLDFNLVDKYAKAYYVFLESIHGLKIVNINDTNMMKYIK